MEFVRASAQRAGAGLRSARRGGHAGERGAGAGPAAEGGQMGPTGRVPLVSIGSTRVHPGQVGMTPL